MLVRSASTPVLGSLLPSFSEIPNHFHQPKVTLNPNHKHQPVSPCPNKLVSFHRRSGSNGLIPCNSSPISPSVANNGFRRVQSEGHLEMLSNSATNEDEFNVSNPLKKFPSRAKISHLETIPSFSFRNSGSRCEEEEDEEEEYEDFHEYISGGATGGNFRQDSGKGGGGGDSHGIEDHYKQMVIENPGNPLFLSNYAQFLYQTMQDLPGAEEYYSRSILADPNDGETLSQYAKLLWELHHDKDRATGYFERAVQAASEDSHVHAAYANFLWETEDEEDDEDESSQTSYIMPTLLRKGAMASATA